MPIARHFKGSDWEVEASAKEIGGPRRAVAARRDDMAEATRSFQIIVYEVRNPAASEKVPDVPWNTLHAEPTQPCNGQAAAM